MSDPITVTPVTSKADRKAFVELAYRLNGKDPAWVPPLRMDVYELLTPGKNPWFEHGEQQPFLARRGGAHDLGAVDIAEQRFEPAERQRLVVDEQDTERAHAATPSSLRSSGRRAIARKPRSRVSVSSVPLAP